LPITEEALKVGTGGVDWPAFIAGLRETPLITGLCGPPAVREEIPAMMLEAISERRLLVGDLARRKKEFVTANLRQMSCCNGQ
jgi:hypothetical protein